MRSAFFSNVPDTSVSEGKRHSLPRYESLAVSLCAYTRTFLLSLALWADCSLSRGRSLYWVSASQRGIQFFPHSLLALHVSMSPYPRSHLTPFFLSSVSQWLSWPSAALQLNPRTLNVPEHNVHGIFSTSSSYAYPWTRQRTSHMASSPRTSLFMD